MCGFQNSVVKKHKWINKLTNESLFGQLNGESSCDFLQLVILNSTKKI